MLPPPYAIALRLRDLGVPDHVVAEALDVDPLSLPPLLDLAEAKLASIMRSRGTEADKPTRAFPEAGDLRYWHGSGVAVGRSR